MKHKTLVTPAPMQKRVTIYLTDEMNAHILARQERLKRLYGLQVSDAACLTALIEVALQEGIGKPSAKVT